MTKLTPEQMRDEIAKLNLQIKTLNTEARLEHARARARQASGAAHLGKARAIHARRKARFGELRDRFLAKGYPLGQASKRASKELKRL